MRIFSLGKDMRSIKALPLLIILLAVFLSYYVLSPTGNLSSYLEANIQWKPFIKWFLIPILWSSWFWYMWTKKALTFAVAIYLLFYIYCIAEYVTFGKMHSTAVGIYTAIAFSLSFLYLLIIQKGYKYRWFTTAIFIIILFFLLLLPAIFIVYFKSFNLGLGEAALFAIFQTNFNEAGDFVKDFILGKYIAEALVIIFLILLLLPIQTIRKTTRVNRPKLLISFTVLFVALTVSQAKYLKVPNLAFFGAQKYQKELVVFKDLQEKRAKGQAPIHAKKEGLGETYIVVIGESLNRQHMGVYGYFRPTTPQLKRLNKKDELILYNHAFSNHTHTMPSLSWALTQANQSNNISYFNSASIIDIAKAAGFKTYWISNQNMLGAWDNLVSILAHSADNLDSINQAVGKTTRTQTMDEELLPYIKRALTDQTKENKMIFVHLMGNHGSYCSRFTKDFEQFAEPLDQAIFGKKVASNSKRVKKINCYDNSVIYNDFIIDNIIEALREQNQISALVYFSDHADDVVRGLGHNSALFTFSMSKIPLIFWTSNQYNTTYSSKLENIERHKNKIFTNDFIFDTVTGLAGIQTKLADTTFDLTQKAYQPNPKSLTTLHGDISFIDPKHYTWWHRHNFKKLIGLEQENRVIPLRVNSTAKLFEVWNAGFRSFETDILFDKKSKTFIVGHGKDVRGFAFTEFIESVDTKKINKILFDLKNLNNENYVDILSRLEFLDKKHVLKDRLIIESGTRSPLFKKFKELDWHISYYLPTGKMVRLLKENDKKGLTQLAKDISRQVKKQNVSAVSFDNRGYPFVKNYLEPLLNSHIVYHSWYGPKIDNKDFIHQLNQSDIYQDDRVKTVLVPFKSPFNL